MKYQCQTIINSRLEKVCDLFMDQSLMSKWQDGLSQIEMINGLPGQNGSKANLHFKFDNNVMIMQETIEENSLPNTLIAIYEVKGAWNRCVNHFSVVNNQVLWIMDSEFRFEEEIKIPLSSFISKTQQGMEIFKNFVENYQY